jgi:hypothetical protein
METFSSLIHIFLIHEENSLIGKIFSFNEKHFCTFYSFMDKLFFLGKRFT